MTAIPTIKNRLVLKDNMENTVSLKSTKVLKENSNGNSPPRDKILVLIQIPSLIKYKTVIRPRKEKKKKYLSFMTQA